MANIYKTSQGKEIDLGKIMLKNEEVRAVGNMKVNARGDAIDSDNNKIADRSKSVSKNYRKQIGNVVKDMPVVNSKKSAQLTAEKYVSEAVQITEVAGLDDEITQPVTQSESAENIAEVIEEVKGGLAEAIAKAREVKQEVLPSQREEERGSDGVNKI